MCYLYVPCPKTTNEETKTRESQTSGNKEIISISSQSRRNFFSAPLTKRLQGWNHVIRVKYLNDNFRYCRSGRHKRVPASLPELFSKRRMKSLGDRVIGLFVLLIGLG